jgi:hypothetical protein
MGHPGRLQMQMQMQEQRQMQMRGFFAPLFAQGQNDTALGAGFFPFDLRCCGKNLPIAFP